MSPPNWPKLAESRDSAPTEQKMTHSTPENQIKMCMGLLPTTIQIQQTNTCRNTMVF